MTVFLFLTTSTILISISTTAFGVFYYNFIPQTDLERPIYLQYAADTYPSAEILLETNALISQQPYDVSIELHMPRNPVNLAAGNFMLDLTLHNTGAGLEAGILKTLNLGDQASSSVLHRSRRPAILPYTSTLSNLASKMIRLPLHVLSFHDSDSVRLSVPMFEEVEFARGKDNIPRMARLEVQSQTLLLATGSKGALPVPQLNVYSAKLVFQVRFHGLRYLIYNYRAAAFVLFTALFYTVSISTLVAGWALLATVFSGKSNDKSLIKSEQGVKIKQEPGQETSDALRTASDYKSDRTLKIKDADNSENETVNIREAWTAPEADVTVKREEQTPVPAVNDGPAEPEARPEDHADDEEEESDDEWQQLEKLRRKMEQDARQRQLQRQQYDSGIGTSLESENASRSGLARRTSSRKGSEREK